MLIKDSMMDQRTCLDHHSDLGTSISHWEATAEARPSWCGCSDGGGGEEMTVFGTWGAYGSVW